jgi:hypothetical protein
MTLQSGDIMSPAIRFPRAAGRAHLRFLAVAVLSAAACSKDQLLEVQTPDIITIDKVSSAAGAQAQRVAAIGQFASFFAGGVAMNQTSGILADEAFVARNGTEHLDSRAQNNASFPANAPWSPFGSALTAIVRAIRGLTAYPPTPASLKVTQLGQLYMLLGFTYVLMAENYCNGIPVSNVTDDAPSSTVLTTAQLYGRALTYFDSALVVLSTSAADQQFRYGARIGKGRTYIDLNQYDRAAAVVAAGGDGAGSVAVPTTYVYATEYSAVSGANGVYDWFVSTKNFGASDKEGINGLDFVSSKDPRIKVDGTKLGAGQDGTLTPLFLLFPNANSPVPLATGVEARMIEAENSLKTGNVAGYLAALNDARVSMPGLAPLADPGAATARVDLLFRERAFWMYFTAHRLGDLRRLIRQYGRNSESVYPTGAYFKGGRYGSDLVLIPDQTETNNPDWSAPAGRTEACIDKNA